MKLQPKRRFWNFYEDGVTQSFINMFQTCRLQTKLYYVDGWTPKKTPVWWHFGSCVHYVLSRSYANSEPPKYLQICEYINAFATANQSELQFDEDVQTLEQIYGFAEKVCYHYFQHYKSDFDHNWIYNESTFKIPYAISTHPESKNTFLTGRFDGGFRTKEGHYSLIDTKCLSQINIPDLLRILPADTQVMFYSLAATILQGEFPKQIYYNIIRHPMNKMTKKDNSLHDLINRVSDAIEKDPKYYFIRLSIPIAKIEINEWCHDFLMPVLADIQKWFDSGCPSYYSNPGLHGKYGLSQMFDLIVNKDQSKYFKREHVFQELVD